MITVLRAEQRLHEKKGKREVWLSFDPREAARPSGAGFGLLEHFNDTLLPPGDALPLRPRGEAELVTFVWEGAIAHEDSLGNSGIIHAGEFQRLTSGGEARHGERNASRTEWAHFFQIWLKPSEAAREPSHEERRFSAAQRRDGLCVIASFDARQGSLKLREDAVIYSAVLDQGQHLVHELSDDRAAWLHLLTGTITFDDTVLRRGDSAGMTRERAVSITAQERSEILLIDLPGLPSPLPGAAP